MVCLQVPARAKSAERLGSKRFRKSLQRPPAKLLLANAQLATGFCPKLVAFGAVPIQIATPNPSKIGLESAEQHI